MRAPHKELSVIHQLISPDLRSIHRCPWPYGARFAIAVLTHAYGGILYRTASAVGGTAALKRQNRPDRAGTKISSHRCTEL